jgi:hypothetical protein
MARGGLATAVMLAAFTLPVLLAGCPGDPPPAQIVTRPIDKNEATGIIAKAFHQLGVDPEAGHVIHVGQDQKELRLDVAAKGKQWGIAYIMSQDGEKLGADLPQRKDQEVLMVMRGAGDGEQDARAVLLFAGDYLQDDLSGEAHTSTSIAAEAKLDLAARDVVRRAEAEGWK